MKTVKPMTAPPIRVLCDLAGSVEDAVDWSSREINTAGMFNFTTPAEKKVEFTIEDRDGVFVIFSRAYPIHRDGTGSAINWVAEKDTRESAEELVAGLKRLC